MRRRWRSCRRTPLKRRKSELEVSRFGWEYDSVKECYFLSGRVTVETKDGKKVSFGKGDFVTFPRGLACAWDIKEPFRKHYNFRRP
jgi:uncharacterized cupin superfamily protein